MRKLLTKMLPRLHASDAPLLNGEQRAILNQALSSGPDSPALRDLRKDWNRPRSVMAASPQTYDPSF
jgi:hypothetical protein